MSKDDENLANIPTAVVITTIKSMGVFTRCTHTHTRTHTHTHTHTHTQIPVVKLLVRLYATVFVTIKKAKKLCVFLLPIAFGREKSPRKHWETITVFQY